MRNARFVGRSGGSGWLAAGRVYRRLLARRLAGRADSVRDGSRDVADADRRRPQ